VIFDFVLAGGLLYFVVLWVGCIFGVWRCCVLLLLMLVGLCDLVIGNVCCGVCIADVSIWCFGCFIVGGLLCWWLPTDVLFLIWV